ncbi:MAG: hypothetical protein NC231_12735 [Bacillus sp. (in: Bacteria)]|nr:hypothetical protein [Bacillus sp. (in: firmicutes)]MCM1427788.1 hypothetical protein [Eubacterium sp.]
MEQMKYFVTIIMIICYGLPMIMAQTDANKFIYQKDITESVYQSERDAIDNKWQNCDLEVEEWPNYDFFINAQQKHYNLSLENAVAFVVKDYMNGKEKELWELKQIYHYKDDIYQAYTESDMGNELYILFKTNTPDTLPRYVIAADIRKNNVADILLYGEYSYNSMLEWYSYKDWFDGKMSTGQLPFDVTNEIYDSIYNGEVRLAIYDYVDMADKDTRIHWELDGNFMYVGENGYIVCANCSNGVQNIILFVDVWNKTYAVLT